MSGYIDDLSEEQEVAFLEMKKLALQFREEDEANGNTLTEVEEEIFNDETVYLRFLRARNFDVDRAMEMYLNSVKWRRGFQDNLGVEGITEESVENCLSTGESFFYGYDKLRRPIIYVRVKYHISGVMDPEEIERFLVWHMETARVILRPKTETCLVIYDMQDFGLSNMDYSLMKKEIELMQNYYPESQGTTLIINSPWVFKGCWMILKKWIDEKSQDKILFVDVEEIKNYVDEDVLIAEYGGNDPYEFNYIKKIDRVGENADYLPPWEMPWITDWKNENGEDEALNEINNNNNENQDEENPQEGEGEEKPQEGEGEEKPQEEKKSWWSMW
eukprot:TRINITY_DN2610_c0_g1_i1.p1 TRINITY_DN2610_c0_g1~~TRINITY_DN2610_c0_g1_i1.p1  ORF type:complete len:331 (+),score=141.01 TRINITY_DN2610_c0_g1_i1:96-1088(+)